MGLPMAQVPLDPFALGGKPDNDEAEILNLFHRWLEQHRVIDEILANNDDEDVFNDAVSRGGEIEDQIFALRGGAMGLASNPSSA